MGENATRCDPKKAAVVGASSAEGGAAVQIAVGPLHKRSLRRAAIRATEGMQRGKHAIRCDPEDRSLISIRAAKSCGSVEMAVRALNQSSHRAAPIHSAERKNGREVAVGSDSEHRAIFPVGPAELGGAIKPPIFCLEQPRLWILRVGSESTKQLYRVTSVRRPNRDMRCNHQDGKTANRPAEIRAE
jgi:hypothetical protein